MFCEHLLAEMSGKRNAIIPPAARITIELESVDITDGPTIKIIDETSHEEEERQHKVFYLILGNSPYNICNSSAISPVRCGGNWRCSCTCQSPPQRERCQFGVWATASHSFAHCSLPPPSLGAHFIETRCHCQHP